MTLILTVDPLTAGAVPPLVLEGRDAVIGRGAGVDLAVPDPQVSARHCEIGYRNGLYLIRDTSTNGTTLNGAMLSGIARLAGGDVIGIGGATIRVREQATGEDTATVASPEDASLVMALSAAMATLLAARTRQLKELGATLPDTLARNPLANGDGLAGLDGARAAAAVAQATEAIERHHAAALHAMAASLRAVLAEIAPEAIAARARSAPTAAGEAREAALWRAYVGSFDGEALGGAGFVDRFARAFRQQYEALSSAPRPPS